MSEKTCRSYLGVLYPDSEIYDCEKVLERIKDFFELSCWCLHDKDTDENGELKKPHYHWVGQRSACTLDFVATSLELSPNSIEYCRKFKRSVRYLIHADNLGKFQYSQSDIVSSFDVSRYFQGESEAADMETLVDFLFRLNVGRFMTFIGLPSLRASILCSVGIFLFYHLFSN